MYFFLVLQQIRGEFQFLESFSGKIDLTRHDESLDDFHKLHDLVGILDKRAKKYSKLEILPENVTQRLERLFSIDDLSMEHKILNSFLNHPTMEKKVGNFQLTKNLTAVFLAYLDILQIIQHPEINEFEKLEKPSFFESFYSQTRLILKEGKDESSPIDGYLQKMREMTDLADEVVSTANHFVTRVTSILCGCFNVVVKDVCVLKSAGIAFCTMMEKIALATIKMSEAMNQVQTMAASKMSRASLGPASIGYRAAF